jgi:hypothetical protein
MMALEKRVLRRMFGPKRYEVQGSGENYIVRSLRIFFTSTNIIRAIKSRRMRWAGHVVLWERGEVQTGFWWGLLNERDHL